MEDAQNIEVLHAENRIKFPQLFINEMSRDIVLTDDFMRARHIMLTVDLDILKVISSGRVC
jgi:hypothetical protein